MAYNMVVVEIRQTEVYARWFRRLRDRQARVRIDSRIRQLSLGNPGDVSPVREGVSEIRIDYGPGYRVYFTQQGGGPGRPSGRRRQGQPGAGHTKGAGAGQRTLGGSYGKDADQTVGPGGAP